MATAEVESVQAQVLDLEAEKKVVDDKAPVEVEPEKPEEVNVQFEPEKTEDTTVETESEKAKEVAAEAEPEKVKEATAEDEPKEVEPVPEVEADTAEKAE